MSIGTRIKKHRLLNNWTQKELSNQLNLSDKMISFYENDERIPPADILIKLAQIFSVSTDYLLGLTLSDDEPLNRQSDISPEENFILSMWRKLDADYKDIVIGELKKCIKLQQYEFETQRSKKQKKQA